MPGLRDLAHPVKGIPAGGSAMADVRYSRSIPEVLADAMNQFTALVRKETQLGRGAQAQDGWEITVNEAVCGVICLKFEK